MRANGGVPQRLTNVRGVPAPRTPPPRAAGRWRGPWALVPTPGAKPSRATGGGFNTGDALHRRGDLESSRRPGAPPPPCASDGGAPTNPIRCRSGLREQRADAQVGGGSPGAGTIPGRFSRWNASPVLKPRGLRTVALPLERGPETGAPPATCRTRRWRAWSTGSTVEERHPSPSPQPSPCQGEGVATLRRQPPSRPKPGWN